MKVNNLVSFVNLVFSTVPIVGRVTGVTETEATIVGVTTVPGEVEGELAAPIMLAIDN